MPKPKPRFRRWTTDTEVAFLMALRVTGSVTRACAEIGRSTHGAGDRRRRLPDFAAKWQAVLDEWQAEQAAARRADVGADEERAMDNRERYDGMTPLRQRAFLRALTETGSYEEACKRVRLSAVGVRKMRKRYPDFAAACERALSRSVATLEQAAVDRAVQGVEEPVWHAGKIVGTRVVRSDGLLKTMLDRGGPELKQGKTKKERVEIAKEAAKLAGGSFVPEIVRTAEEVFESIAHKLDRIASLRRRQEAERAVVLLEMGKIP
jgi:hypothetical protein